MGHQVRRILPFAWLLLSLCLWQLASVSMADETPAPPASAPAAIPQYTNEELLTQMLAVDVSERSLDTLPALAITFSQELDPKADYNAFITLTSGGKRVEGSWVMASETRRLFFTNIKPQTEYRIQVRPGIASKHDQQLQKPVRSDRLKPVM